jgi:peptidoglycan hydrolase-like protein with peptidoglycan-binding domain
MTSAEQRFYVLDSSIEGTLRQAAKKAIANAAPLGSRFLPTEKTGGFDDLREKLRELSEPDQIRENGKISDMTIVAHGYAGGVFSLGDDFVTEGKLDEIDGPFDVFADHARIDIVRCASSTLPIEESDRRSLYRKVGEKLLPRGGRVCGTKNDVEFSWGGGVRLTKPGSGGNVPLGGSYPTTFHSLEYLKYNPQECEEIPGPNESSRVYRTLRYGDRGEDVEQLQKFLRVKPDGKYGPFTKSSVKRFQRQQGLAATGIVDAGTHRAIRRHDREPPKVHRTLRVGSLGADVRRLQRFLGVQRDGRFGPQTSAALKSWQQGMGLHPDGVAGPNTIRAINRLRGGNPSIYRRLETGSEGADVRRLQGVIGARQDGLFGPETERKLRGWQRNHGLAADGIAGPQTHRKMQSTLSANAIINRTLRSGSRGDDVRRLQGVIGARQDGVFGPETERKLRAWQRNHGLAADGIAGQHTFRKMHTLLQP